MTTMRWFRAGATPRGTPAFRRSLRRRPVIFLALAFASLVQTGCQSGPFGCGTCGGFGSRIRATGAYVLSPVRNVFRPVYAPSAGCCGGSTMGVEAAPISYGSPAVITPGTLGTPLGSALPAPGELPPTNLEAIPNNDRTPAAFPGPAPGSGPAGEATPAQGSKPSTSKTNYEAFRYKSGQGQSRSGALARSAKSSSEPTNRSAQGPKSPPAPDAIEIDPLDNLPPIELPTDLTRTNPTPEKAALAPAVVSERKPASGISPLAAKAAEGLPAGANVAPGIRRFSGVESKLAGGSLPDASGLDWLVEKGYKTILDLREDSELSPGFVSDVARRGLRYVALPISLKTVDREHVARFHFELSLTEARPLFFCDTDGTRAGVLWYIRRVTVDKVDPLIARRDAEELGLNDTKFWRAAEDHLDAIRRSESPAPAPAPKEDAKKLDSTPSPTPAPAPTSDTNAPAAPNAGPSPTASNGESPNPFSDERDDSAWKPFAAMVVTGLGVPLAYMGRNALPYSFSAFARASLPGPRRLPKSLPSGSDG